MHNTPLFDIHNVANGFIVRINKQHFGGPSLIPAEYTEAIRNMTDAIKGSDDVMTKIKEEQRRIQNPPLSDLKDNDMYVFKTFPEVLKFLEYKFGE